MTFFLEPFRQIYRYRRILFRTARVELKGAYAGSLLGVLWVALGPLLLMTMYAVLFVLVLDVRPTGMSASQYLNYMFAGLVPFIAFSSAVTAGAGSLAKSRQVLLNTVFPAELLPIRTTLVSSIVLPVGLLVLVLIDWATGAANVHLLLLPAFVAFQLLFTCGVAWLLSLASLAIRDMQYALQYVMMTLLFLSPIAFTAEMAPRVIKVLMYANPLFYYVQVYQSLIALDRLPDPAVLATAVALAFLSFGFGYWIFQRAKQVFLDYA